MPGKMFERFNIGPIFNGYITELNIFDSFLGHEKMANWTSCTAMDRGNIYSWNAYWWNTTPSKESIQISVEQIETKEFCPEKRNVHLQLFDDNKMQINQIFASKLCRRMNGLIVSPPLVLEDTYELMEISYSRDVWFWTSGKARVKSEWTKDFYPEKGVYEYYDESTGEDIEPLRENDFPFFKFIPEVNTYSIIPELCILCGRDNCKNAKCSQSQRDVGALCKVESIVWLNLKGLCTETSVDRRYRLVEPKTNGIRNSYIGDSGWIITYEYESKAWKISNKMYRDKTLTMKVNDRLPVGRSRWEIANNECNEGVTDIQVLQISACHANQFTCDEGTCVPLVSRCDTIEDCDDLSDERNCNLVYLDENKYRKERPPTQKEKEKVPVNVTLNIRSVLDINEVDMVMKLLFDLELSWFDNRLQFYNLKRDDNLNTLTHYDQHIVWTPTVLFDNTEKQLTSLNDGKSFAKVRRFGNGTRSGNTYNEDIDIFEGNDNPIHLSRSYDIDFICEYDMRCYPFDYQTCNMVILMNSNIGIFVDLVADSLTYSGPKELTQYFVKKTVMSVKDFGSKHGTLVVSISLGRRLLGTFLTIFLPTVLVNLIGHATNFFKDFFFEAVVTVNLTGKETHFFKF